MSTPKLKLGYGWWRYRSKNPIIIWYEYSYDIVIYFGNEKNKEGTTFLLLVLWYHRFTSTKHHLIRINITNLACVRKNKYYCCCCCCGRSTFTAATNHAPGLNLWIGDLRVLPKSRKTAMFTITIGIRRLFTNEWSHTLHVATVIINIALERYQRYLSRIYAGLSADRYWVLSVSHA